MNEALKRLHNRPTSFFGRKKTRIQAYADIIRLREAILVGLFTVSDFREITSVCPYHVTFDLDHDLEHILDAGQAGNHRVQVWWQVCFGRKKSNTSIH